MDNKDHLINLHGAATSLNGELYNLKDEELAELYDICKFLGYLSERVRQVLTERCLRQSIVGGKYLRKMPGPRMIENIGAAYMALRDIMPKEVFQRACRVSVTKLQKNYVEIRREQDNSTDMTVLEQEFNSRLENVIMREPVRMQIAQWEKSR